MSLQFGNCVSGWDVQEFLQHRSLEVTGCVLSSYISKCGLAVEVVLLLLESIFPYGFSGSGFHAL